ncbi:SSU ribosomal protein S2p (SAe), partial [Pseudomonas amygdali pv. morsprunorum]
QRLLSGAGGGYIAGGICLVALGITTGPGALACTIIGGAAGGWVGGEGGQWVGERIGEYIYEAVSK